MKKFILILILILIVATPCLARDSSSPLELKSGEKLKMYDKHGSYQGYYKQDGSKVKKYGRNGNYEGYYQK